jgi:dTDP-D-glucose 4,6-dehydratase
MPNILITGGAGFIGSEMLRQLKELSSKCLTPFDQGLQLTIEWYLNNPGFLQKAK